MENPERLGRQARPGFEPGTSRLPVLSVTAVPLVGLLRILGKTQLLHPSAIYTCTNYINAIS